MIRGAESLVGGGFGSTAEQGPEDQPGQGTAVVMAIPLCHSLSSFLREYAVGIGNCPYSSI